ncbi:hypothetical protein [Halobacterium zhouii]|uniref:hypothetical protein n=1 Tax=Halobacterium zhouii TaxID=2902624 RepID=UPI001E2B0741|nr:hypothetical protein [Halobacterium zhouii]
MRVRERLGVAERRQRQATRAMQLSLVGFLFVGLYRGNVGITVNAGLALLVTYVPAVLERDYGIPMDAGITLWITAAVFLHALGTVGLPGIGGKFYGPDGIPWWDHLTHALSSSIVAAAGYAVARALDEHNTEVYLPPKFMFVFLLLFVLAFGVLWEVLEFAVTALAGVLGTGAVLTIYGVNDTLLDLVFNTVGAVVVAVWGTAYLTDVATAIRAKFDGRNPGERA